MNHDSGSVASYVSQLEKKLDKEKVARKKLEEELAKVKTLARNITNGHI